MSIGFEMKRLEGSPNCLVLRGTWKNDALMMIKIRFRGWRDEYAWKQLHCIPKYEEVESEGFNRYVLCGEGISYFVFRDADNCDLFLRQADQFCTNTMDLDRERISVSATHVSMMVEFHGIGIEKSLVTDVPCPIGILAPMTRIRLEDKEASPIRAYEMNPDMRRKITLSADDAQISIPEVLVRGSFFVTIMKSDVVSLRTIANGASISAFGMSIMNLYNSHQQTNFEEEIYALVSENEHNMTDVFHELRRVYAISTFCEFWWLQTCVALFLIKHFRHTDKLCEMMLFFEEHSYPYAQFERRLLQETAITIIHEGAESSKKKFLEIFAYGLEDWRSDIIKHLFFHSRKRRCYD